MALTFQVAIVTRQCLATYEPDCMCYSPITYVQYLAALDLDSSRTPGAASDGEWHARDLPSVALIATDSIFKVHLGVGICDGGSMQAKKSARKAPRKSSRKRVLTRARAKKAAKAAKKAYAKGPAPRSVAWKKGGREWVRVLGHFGSSPSTY